MRTTDTQKTQIVKLSSDHTALEISKITGVHQRSVRSILAARGFKAKPFKNCTWLNDDFFTFSKPEYAYIAGFFCADGCICQGKISIGINEADFNEIRPILAQTGQWNEYRIIKRKKSHKQAIDGYINDYKLFRKLEALGIKNKTLKFPVKFYNLVPKNFQYLFWRGYFDGDGCWSNGQSKCFSIAAHKDFNWKYIKKFLKNIGVFNTHTHISKNPLGQTNTLAITHRYYIIKLGDFIYQDNINIGLSRKYNKFLDIKNYYISISDKYPIVPPKTIF